MKQLIVFVIKLYKRFGSAFIRSVFMGGRHACIYFPTCSHYTELAISQYGIIKGSFLSIKRLLRCHPWARGGDDPVPKRLNR